MGYNRYPPTGAVNTVTASSPLASSGGATPDISLSGTVDVAHGGTNSSTALNNNRFIVSSGGKIAEASAVTANRAVISDANGLPVAAATTATEIGYVNGVTSSIQTQIGNTYPPMATLWHIQSVASVGNPVVCLNLENQCFGQWGQSPPANGDTFTNTFWCAAGTYGFFIFGSQNDNRAKIDWYIDNVLFISGQDWFGSLVYNVSKTDSITIVGNGLHTLKGVANGKNAGSSGYYIVLSTIWIK